MTIECPNLESLMDCVAGLVKRGLTFKADASILTITLTGGY